MTCIWTSVNTRTSTPHPDPLENMFVRPVKHCVTASEKRRDVCVCVCVCLCVSTCTIDMYEHAHLFTSKMFAPHMHCVTPQIHNNSKDEIFDQRSSSFHMYKRTRRCNYAYLISPARGSEKKCFLLPNIWAHMLHSLYTSKLVSLVTQISSNFEFTHKHVGRCGCWNSPIATVIMQTVDCQMRRPRLLT